MFDTAKKKMASNMATAGVHYLDVIPYGEATGITKDVYDQMNDDMAIAPPFVINSQIPELFAAAWSAERESVAAGSVDIVKRQAVCAGISYANQCPYCVEAHSFQLYGGGKDQVVDSINEGAFDQIEDEEYRKIVQWTQQTYNPNVQMPNFSQEEKVYFIATALNFHNINRMVNIYADDSPIPSFMSFAKSSVIKYSGKTLGKQFNEKYLEPGKSLKFLPEADYLPEEFSWAKDSPILSQVYARWNKVNQDLEKEIAPTVVQKVKDYLATWQGERLGMSRQWIDDLTQGMDAGDKIATKLALLSAVASYQVTDDLVEEFFKYYDSKHLLRVTAWGSFSAVKLISNWIGKI